MLERVVPLLDGGEPLWLGDGEILLLDGIQGHVSATYDALGLFSVGFTATCTQ